MAGSSMIVRANAPRALQLGLDDVIKDNMDYYQGPGDDIFKSKTTEKAYMEFLKISGMGLASEKGEGEPITYESGYDQAWIYTIPVVTMEKGARISKEMIADNLYDDVLDEVGKEQIKSLNQTRDQLEANIFNNAFSGGPTYGDGSALIVSNHALQNGSTNSNILAVAEDLSEDALEQLKLVADFMKNDDGLVGNYELENLIIRNDLQFEAHRILKSMGQVHTPDNTANALREMGIIKKIIPWKRLSSSISYFITTSCDNGLLLARRENIYVQTDKDPYTWDVIATAGERYGVGVRKHQCVVGTPGV